MSDSNPAADFIADDDAKNAALRAELEQPSPYSHIIGGSDVIEPDPAEDRFGVYANENLYSHLTEEEMGDGRDLQFEAYTAEDGSRGYLVTKRPAE